MTGRTLLPMLALLLAFSIAAASGPAKSATFQVDSTADTIDAAPGDGFCADATGACSLRAAVIEANQLPGTDDITVPAGAYVLTLTGPPEDDGLSGDLDLREDVTIRGAGAAATVVDANGAEAVFTISTPSVGLERLTVHGGSDAGVSVFGGLSLTTCIVESSAGDGIRGDSSVLYASGTVVRDNAGNGIRLQNAPAVLFFESGQIQRNGVALSLRFAFNYASPGLVRQTVIEDNLAGPFAEDCSLRFEDAVVRRNGSGITSSEARLEIVRSSIEDNLETGVAAALNGYGSMLLSDSAVVRNTSSSIGGVTVGAFYAGQIDIVNTTISGNSGSEIGGIGIRAQPYNSSLRLLNSTVTDNDGARVGGIGARGIGCCGYIEDVSGSLIAGTIVAGNMATSGSGDCGQFNADGPLTLPFSGGNVVGNTSGCNFSLRAGNQVGDALNPIDPLLGPLAMNGGPTLTHALLAGSPAIDAGAGPCYGSDQRGVYRPIDGDGDGVAGCDSGAFEYASVDADADGVVDESDDCPLVEDADQLDSDADGVGDACDSCVLAANPRVESGALITKPWLTLTGGQRDDDRDGYGNRCDAKFPGVSGRLVGSGDLAQLRASNGKSVSQDICGSDGATPCAIFDLSEAATLIGAPDLARFRLSNGKPPGPTCASCPLDCVAGPDGSCN